MWPAKSWFEQLTGFAEKTPEFVRRQMVLDGDRLTSRVNGRTMICGRLETPSLAELRTRIDSCLTGSGGLRVREIITDVRKLHADPASAGALFQVASQFNLLEMTGPHVTPEEGVAIYELDFTQGPACAIAAGAGTIYRNYFASVNGRIGQSAENQIDCLADLGQVLGNLSGQLWTMSNGYAMATIEGLREIDARLASADENERDSLRRLLRIGLQHDTEVTLEGTGHRVSQAYCSALPVTYSSHKRQLWERFARLVLEAAYEATICAAIARAQRGGDNRVFLTLLGGGAFGNEIEWIVDAAWRAMDQYRRFDLDVAFVSRGASNPELCELIDAFS